MKSNGHMGHMCFYVFFCSFSTGLVLLFFSKGWDRITLPLLLFCRGVLQPGPDICCCLCPESGHHLILGSAVLVFVLGIAGSITYCTQKRGFVTFSTDGEMESLLKTGGFNNYQSRNFSFSFLLFYLSSYQKLLL